MKDKKILITGASKGLGASLAMALAALDARVVLFARTFDKMEFVRKSCKNPDNHLSVKVDLLNAIEIQSAITSATDFLHGIDCIIHCAGGGLGLKEDFIKHDDFLKLFKLNLGAAAEINRLIIPEMVTRGSGNIVHVGSIASSESVGSVGYNSVKAALAAYVRSIGRDLNKFNIVATGILPGAFLAPGNAMDRLSESNPEAYTQFIKDRLPRKVMGTVEELIPLILLLCSKDAAMMGGCMVPIDAGEGRTYLQ